MENEVSDAYRVFLSEGEVAQTTPVIVSDDEVVDDNADLVLRQAPLVSETSNTFASELFRVPLREIMRSRPKKSGS